MRSRTEQAKMVGRGAVGIEPASPLQTRTLSIVRSDNPTETLETLKRGAKEVQAPHKIPASPCRPVVGKRLFRPVNRAMHSNAYVG